MKPIGGPVPPSILVVMGVSGSGKSSVAAALAKALNWPFAEGDDFHPPANIAKMHSGQPLDDEDRKPWLARITAWIDVRRQAREPGVVTCSALKRAYREILSTGRPEVLFIYLKSSIHGVSRRLATRQGHFMPESLLSSQFELLEEPAPDEHVLAVETDDAIAVIVNKIKVSLGRDQPKRPVT